MIQFGLNELDHQKFQQKLPAVFSSVKQGDTVSLTIENYMQKLLVCLYQKTKNNSDITLNAAISLANALHAPLYILSIDTLVSEYCEMMQPALGRQLNWEQDDITLQNIQARARGPSAWILANVRNSILLSTSNRSEASVGYATMDGDTCGGLSPLAGIDKHFILQWLNWLEKEGPFEIGPIPALKMITQQKPTAELRPLSKSQTDEGDLMPYAWLDIIERFFVRDKASPKDILIIMHKQFPDEKLNTLGLSVERFFKRWTESQWKRERFAPSFHLDDENVDPKTACRFPILSAGFKRELKIMWEYIHDKTQ
jgi:NAD+ synthase (glutamine-hydrolysing)